jgi:acyl-coenzyme A thioesterase PaaI-like protein
VSIDEPINFVRGHHCFGCGQLNVGGLQLQLHMDPETNGAYAHFAPDARFQGYDGMIHGGIISTILDEVMAWSLYGIGVWGVTVEMTVRFRKPVAVGQPLVAKGRIERDRRRMYDLVGRIEAVDSGMLLAESTATFMRVSEDQAQAWRERYLAHNEGLP